MGMRLFSKHIVILSPPVAAGMSFLIKCVLFWENTFMLASAICLRKSVAQIIIKILITKILIIITVDIFAVVFNIIC